LLSRAKNTVREAEPNARIWDQLAVKRAKDTAKIARLKALRLAKRAGEDPG